MRLYLAVAVLMLAFVAYTGAQAMEEETFEQRMSALGVQMTEVGQGLVEKAKTHFQNLRETDFAVQTQNWFQDKIAKMKESFQK